MSSSASATGLTRKEKETIDDVVKDSKRLAIEAMDTTVTQVCYGVTVHLSDVAPI